MCPEYWGGQEGKWDKIVLSPCNGGKLLSYYCFFPREQGDYTNQAWGADDRPVEELLAPYPSLDARVKAHLAIGVEIQPWRLWLHDPYPYIQRGGDGGAVAGREEGGAEEEAERCGVFDGHACALALVRHHLCLRQLFCEGF
jgi:hypothetical protein